MSSTSKKNIIWFYILSFSFLLINFILIKKEIEYALLLPLIIITIFAFIYQFDLILLIIAFATPLSILLTDSRLGFDVSVPTEPMLVLVSFIFILQLLRGVSFDKKILTHSISIAILVNLIWIFITSLTSELPIVSFKYLISELWFVIPFFFLGTLFFKDKKNINRFIWCYGISLIIVIFITTYKHSAYNFATRQGHWIMRPFYNDHTEYGMILAFIFPLFIALILNNKKWNMPKFIAIVFAVIILVALYISNSRAAWLSFVGGAAMVFIIYFKIKIRWLAITSGVLIIVFFSFKNDIIHTLEKNKQTSSGNFIEHVKSIYNVSSDDSNLERINRWQAAKRLYKERPVFGWGPGTYQFVYAPFQLSRERTTISTNVGDLGNAHSEYFRPLSEQGLIGFIIIVILFSTILLKSIRIYYRTNNKELKNIILAIVFAFTSYFIHSFLNNFLGNDKASVPFWALCAILVTIDIYYSNENTKTITNLHIE